MAHVTIDHSPVAWVVNGPMIKVSIFCVYVCGLEVIVIPTWCKANWSTAAACGCFPKKENTLFFWDKKERWTNALFLFSVVSKWVSLKMSDPSAVYFCVCVWSFPEQPADHSLTISWFLADWQLCIQLPAPLAPQSDHKLGKWCLPSMVRPGHICVDTVWNQANI